MFIWFVGGKMKEESTEKRRGNVKSLGNVLTSNFLFFAWSEKTIAKTEQTRQQKVVTKIVTSQQLGFKEPDFRLSSELKNGWFRESRLFLLINKLNWSSFKKKYRFLMWIEIWPIFTFELTEKKYWKKKYLYLL